LLNVAYTYLDQKSTALDTGNFQALAASPTTLSSLTVTTVSMATLQSIDWSRTVFTICRLERTPIRFLDGMLGKTQSSAAGQPHLICLPIWNGFTPFWICDDCNPVEPGNIGVSSIDAVGDFNAEPSYRPTILNSSFNKKDRRQYLECRRVRSAVRGSRRFSNPANAKRNLLWGPGTWGVNLGVHKDFHFGERVTAQLGADVDNVF